MVFRFSRPAALICGLLAVVTLAVYLPAINFSFINFDDPNYVTENPYVQRGLNAEDIAWAFKSGHAANWHPLTWLSHMLDASLFGNNATGPHLINVLLHTANSLLLFLLLNRITGARWRSAFVAALFALHPLHVESVAWISERKDVLSAFFAMLTLLAYAEFANRAKERSPTSKVWYLATVGLFVLGLMAKPMLVTLPFVMLLLDYWPLGRIADFKLRTADGKKPVWVPLVLEKIPLLVLSAVSSIVTFLVQKEGGAIRSLATFSFSFRLENAFVSYARYLGKTFWPFKLALPYPPVSHWSWEMVFFSIALVLCLSAVAVRFWRRWPFVAVGWFWFLGMLVPVIGLVQIGNQSLADRYMYLPSVGIFIAISWLLEGIVFRKQSLQLATGAICGLALVGFTARTWDQLRYWQNTETVFRHALAVTKNNWLAQGDLSFALQQRGEFAEAIEHARRAIELNPNDFVAYDNLGLCLFEQGQIEEAIQNYRQSLELNPKNPLALNNLGNALAREQKFTDAILVYESALKLKPDFVEVRIGLGSALDSTGQTDEASAQYIEALKLAPDSVQAHNNLANTLAGRGQFREAISHYQLALQINPEFVPAWNNLGYVLAATGQIQDAIRCYEKSLELRPNQSNAQKYFADVLAKAGQREAAIAHYREALRLKPGYAEAKQALDSLAAANPSPVSKP